MERTRDHGHVRFWMLSLATIVPALVLAGAALVMPTAGDQVIVTVLGLDVLILLAVYVQPRLLPRPDLRLVEVAHQLLKQGRAVREPSEVIDLLGDLLERAGVADRVLVVLPGAGGKLELYGGHESDGEIVAEWGGEITAADDDRGAIGRLAADLGCGRVLTLRARAALLGVAFVRVLPGAPEAAADWEPIRAHVTFLLVDRRLALAVTDVDESLTIGTSLQEALMPALGTTRAAGVIHHSVLRLTPHCGGDIWTARDLGDGKLLIFVGDATGHGPAAATLSVAIKGVVDGFAMIKGPALRLEQLLGEVDKVVRQIGHHRYLMSAIAAVIDLSRATVTIANAGHPRPYLVDPRDRQAPIRLVDTGAGNLLGSGTLTAEVRTLPLTPETKWVFYTDGISDASVGAGPQYGLRRFRDALRTVVHGSAQAVADAVLADVDRFVGGHVLDDDVVLVVVEIPSEHAHGFADWRTPPPAVI